MDYVFRWLQLRFLTGQQQALFDGLRPKYVNAPPPGTPDEAGQKTFGDFTEPAPSSGATQQSGVILSGAGASSLAPAESKDPYSRNTTAHHHASDALKDLIEMGDSPSCHVCGAIMTRNGSCYRCMSCGSTSGCS
jgi:ribonucleoside-diphosphate reductase alpha chain